MKRKLLLLDIVLIALLAFIGFRFREVRQQAREREARVLGTKIPPEKYPPLPALHNPGPAVAADYAGIAQKMLLSRDRNPDVIVDPAPPPKKPPMPPLPVAHGVMLFGDPSIILSEKAGGPQKIYRAGDTIGAFKLVSFDNTHVVFEWDGETVDRPIHSLLAKLEGEPGGPASRAAAPPAPAAPSATPAALGPGADIGNGMKACQPNDSNASGAVVNGYRKVETPTPFGKSCRWEPVK
jgi:hypothetical protein